jgi:DNA-binding PadR family transcriptional regulator
MHRELFLGFIKLHILYHAAREPVFGLELIAELARHGYSLSPGTLYPLLHRMQQQGLLRMQSRNVGGRIRKYYRTTASGKKLLGDGVAKARELFQEIRDYGAGRSPKRRGGNA